MDIGPSEISWPGLEGSVYSAVMTVVDGISPSVCVLEVPPQPTAFAAFGTLAWGCSGEQLVFPDCRVDVFEPAWTPGLVWRIPILDRRWRWKYGGISGRYNIRYPDLSVVADTEKTPQQLAELCLDAMGEHSYDVADLPNDTRPDVDWDGEVPATCLQSLCESLGCRVVLQLDNTVAIRRAGVGDALPRGDVLEYHVGFDTAECPDEAGIKFGPTLVNVHLPLEAVLSTDIFGSPKTDSEIARAPKVEEGKSGRPAPGLRWTRYSKELLIYLKTFWPRFSLHAFRDKDAPAAEWWKNLQPDARALLESQVFRIYRVRLPFEVPEWGKVESYEQFELDSAQTVTFKDRDGAIRRKTAAVYGSFIVPGEGTWANIIEDVDPKFPRYYEGAKDWSGPLLSSFSGSSIGIDPSEATVHFGDHLCRNADVVDRTKKVQCNVLALGDVRAAALTLILEPAQLVLVTAIRLFGKDRSFLRHEKTRPLNPAPARKREKGTGGFKLVGWHHYRDQWLSGEVEYEQDRRDLVKPTGIKYPGRDDLDRAAEYYLDAIAGEYQTKTPQTAKYPGIVPINLDGAIRQVTYSASSSEPAMTVAARDSERTGGIIEPYSERRRRWKAVAAAEEQQRLASQMAKVKWGGNR